MEKDQITAEIGLLKQRLQNIKDEASWCVSRLDELAQHIDELTAAEEPETAVAIPSPKAEVPTIEMEILSSVEPEAKPMEETSHIKLETVAPSAVMSPTMPAPKPKEAKANLNEKLGQKKEKTPVEHFADSKIDDLKKAFTLNHKLSFIKHLFNNDAESYHTVLDQLNIAENFEAAERILREAITPTDDDIYIEFKNFVKRRFLN